MRVPQLPGERRLVPELRAVYGAELGIPEDLGLDRLERDLAPGKGIPGEVHRPGRAFAERPLDVVPADPKAQAHVEGCIGRALPSRRFELRA